MERGTLAVGAARVYLVIAEQNNHRPDGYVPEPRPYRLMRGRPQTMRYGGAPGFLKN
ncbi:MAG: hypothetical protein AB7G48_04090 [Nitrospiraceae bacterium]